MRDFPECAIRIRSVLLVRNGPVSDHQQQRLHVHNGYQNVTVGGEVSCGEREGKVCYKGNSGTKSSLQDEDSQRKKWKKIYVKWRGSEIWWLRCDVIEELVEMKNNGINKGISSKGGMENYRRAREEQ